MNATINRLGVAWIALIGAIVFSLESWVLGPQSWMYGYGAGLETLPTHLALSYDSRLFSFWAPFVAGGVDRLSFWGNADPLNIEWLFISAFPVWLANGLHRMLQYFIAIYFTSRVCLDQLKLGKEWACLAGLLHASLSYFTFGEMLAFPGVPLLIWVLGWLRQSKWGLRLAAPSGLAFSMLTSFTHSDPYLLIFALGWMSIIWRDITWHTISRIGLFFTALFIGDCHQLIAALANAAQSHRSNMVPEKLGWTIDLLFYRQLQFDFFNQDIVTKLITMNAPSVALLAGGGAAILLILRGTSDHISMRAFFGIALLFVILSQRWLFVGIQNTVGDFIPWIHGIYMGRFFTLPAAFLAGILIACSIQLVSACIAPASENRAHFGLILGLCAVAFMAIWPKLVLMRPLGIDGWGERNFQVPALAQLAKRTQEPFRVASVLPLQPSYAYAQGLEAADGWVNLYPSSYREFWLRILKPLFREVPKAKTIFDPEEGKPQDNYVFLGADLAHPEFGLLPGEDIRHSLDVGFNVDRRFNLTLLGALNVRYLLSELPLQSRHLVLETHGRYTNNWPLSRDWATGKVNSYLQPLGAASYSRPSVQDFREYLSVLNQGLVEKEIFIYRLDTFLPRYRFIRKVELAESGRSVLDKIESMDSAAIEGVALVEKVDFPQIVDRYDFSPGKVSVVEYRPDLIRLQISNTGEGVLLIANEWSPYWKAEVDGKQRKIFRINYVQSGILTHAGEVMVTLRYRPPYAPSVLIEKAFR